MQVFLSISEESDDREWTVFNVDSDVEDLDPDSIVNFSPDLNNDYCLSCSLPILSDPLDDSESDTWCACDDDWFAPVSVAEEIYGAGISARDGLVYWLSPDTVGDDCESCQFSYTDRCPFVGPRIAAINTEIEALGPDFSLVELLDHPLNPAFTQFWRNINSNGSFGITTCARFTPYANANKTEVIDMSVSAVL